MNYYITPLYYPVIYPHQILRNEYRNYPLVNIYYPFSPHHYYHFHTIPEYLIKKTDYYGEGANYLDRQGTVSLQNTADTQWKDWYLDIDGNTGNVILWPRLGSGGYWKLIDHGNGTVSLQNTAGTQWKDWYLDIDGNTGNVILWPRLGSGGYWKLIDHGNGTVSLQNTADTQWKDWYLDIDGNTGNVILWPRLGSGGYWRLTNQDGPPMEQPKKFPVRGEKNTNLGKGRSIQTSVTVSDNGRIDGTSILRSRSLLGFRAYVEITLNSAGGILFRKRYHGYTNAGNATPVAFEDRISLDDLNKLKTVTITHHLDPKPPLTTQQALELAQKLAEIAQETPEAEEAREEK